MISITRTKWIKRIAVVAVWLLLWELIAITVDEEILVVSPFRVFLRLTEMVQEPSFWMAAVFSMGRILSGFLLALLVGVVLAVLTVKVPLAHEFFYPIITVIKATPVASFIILALVWLKTGQVPMFTAFLIVLPVVWGNVSAGIENTAQDLLEMARLFDFSAWKLIRWVYLPSVMPYFITAATVGIGMAWKSGVAAEVISVPQNAIGTQLYFSKIYIETSDLFAWTLVVIVMSMVVEKLFVTLIQKVNKLSPK